MPDIIDVLMWLFFGYLGYKYLLPVISDYGWTILYALLIISAVIGFAVAISNYIVSLIDNMSR